jgi:hypothetical protein
MALDQPVTAWIFLAQGLSMRSFSARKSNRIFAVVPKYNLVAFKRNPLCLSMSLFWCNLTIIFNKLFTMKNLLSSICFFLISSTMIGQTAITRSLPSFDRICVSGGNDVVILQEGDVESVKLDVSGIDPKKITTEVRNNTLSIGTKNGSWSNYKARITVTYRRIKEISNSGSTDIVAKSVIKADEFEFNSSGSGDFEGTFDVKDLDIAISGSSDMKLKGKADTQEIAISGSGDVDASNLTGVAADVAISGSGDVKLGVKGRVKTAVSGSGTVINE